MSAFTDNLRSLQTQLETVRASLDTQIRPQEFAASTVGSGPIDRNIREAQALLNHLIVMTPP
ncbi:MAG TPA: hypothetical protein VKD28_07470 [Gemmatimonadales bacterium]|nr:hypothetical protein [Gemmatimonadales bacterium]